MKAFMLVMSSSTSKICPAPAGEHSLTCMTQKGTGYRIGEPHVTLSRLINSEKRK
jgi:hypothetical protein